MTDLSNNFTERVDAVLGFIEFINKIMADPHKDQRFKTSARLAEIDSLPLNEQLKQFHKFMTDIDVRQRQGGHIRDVTAKNYLNQVLYILGWMHRYRSPTVPLEQLSLTRLVSSSSPAFDNLPDADALNNVMDEVHDYLCWKRNERDILPASELQAVRSLIWVAAYLYHPLSKRSSGYSTPQVKYRDIPIIEKLRQLQSEIDKRNKGAPKVADERKKWIEWPEFLAMVEQLKTECNPIGENNQRRSDSAIAASIQRYLIFAFFSAIPDRQRTFRELEVGRTLFQHNGIWRIEHNSDDFKTGSTYCKKGEKRIIPIPKWFYPDLEAWLHGYEDKAGVWHGYIDESGNRLGWREVFKPNHSCVFTQKCGNKMTCSSLNGLFRYTAYRITGQACHPHLVRNMIVTHLKRSGASSDVLEALARLMAHSLQMQQNIYDRRTPEEKIEPAIKALDSLRREDLNS
jgi:integrase